MAETTYLTVKDVATRLGVHPETVKRWLRAGRLVGYALGDRSGWRTTEADLAAFLAGTKPDAERPPRDRTGDGDLTP